MALTTVTLLTITAGLLEFTVAPKTKFVPISVTLAFVPGAPEFGLIDVRVGGSGLMVNATMPLVLPPEVTLMFDDPVALAAIANVAVI